MQTFTADHRPTKAVSRDAIRDPEHRKAFRFEHFNAMQSACFDALYNSDTNYVISAPTGSGKTVSGIYFRLPLQPSAPPRQVLFELAILRLLERRSAQERSEKQRVICLCPTKALCAERWA